MLVELFSSQGRVTSRAAVLVVSRLGRGGLPAGFSGDYPGIPRGLLGLQGEEGPVWIGYMHGAAKDIRASIWTQYDVHAVHRRTTLQEYVAIATGLSC